MKIIKGFSVTRVLIALAVIGMAFSVSVQAQSVDLALANYNGEGAQPFALFVNTAEHGVQLPGSTDCTPFGCVTTPGPVLNTGAALRIAMPPCPHESVACITHVTQPDPAVVVESEIISGHGALIRVPPLQKLDTWQFLEVGHDGPYNGVLFYGAADAQVFTVAGVAYQMKPDDAIIASTPGRTFTVLSQLGTKGYAFCVINTQSDGSLQIVPAR